MKLGRFIPCLYEIVCALACPRRAATAALVLRYANTEAMTLHLAEIAKTVAPGAHALLVLDGAGWHGGKNLVVPGNITLLPLPPYAPELNTVENPGSSPGQAIWHYLRANKLAITVFDGYDDIVDKCCRAWNRFADDTELVASLTSREWAQVNDKGRWYHLCRVLAEVPAE